MRKIFLIDNYDSFTYNLLYYIEELGCEVTVKRNDKFDQCLGDELSDCLAYCVRLASCCNVDLSAALSHYFP